MSPDTHTRVVRPGQLADVELAERIALFAVVTGHARATTVLEGLGKVGRRAARGLLAKAVDWTSGQKQARAALEFGLRADQHERLARLVAEAEPLLRIAACAHMTPQQQARFPHLANQEHRRLPARDAFAARLVREASR